MPREGGNLPEVSSGGAIFLVRVAISCSTTALAMGTIIAVVAVLLIHMERKAEGSMNPSISLKHSRLATCNNGV